jgi:hypothetical protein
LKKFLILIVLIGWNVSAQNLYLKISGKSEIETKVIDSISYNKKHLNLKSVLDEANLTSEKLIKLGFIDNQILNKKKVNDSIFELDFSLGQKIKFIHIYIGKNSELKNLQIFESKNDTLILPYSNIEVYLNESLKKLEQNGFALSKLKIVDFSKNKNQLTAMLVLVSDKKRILNDIVINGYDKFPEGFKKNLKKKYKKLLFNKENLKLVNNDFNKIRFVKQTKYPEILFTTDSTKVYVYIEKAKTNSFDGFIGFSNDENKNLIFNGYVDLALNNALNIGEKLALYWKSDGKNQKTFNIETEIPYVFKSPIGIKAQLNIFKQDSIFQNTKTNLDLGYYLNLNSKIYLGYQETESNDINNLNSSILSDSKNSFITLTYEFKEFNSDDFLFPEKLNFNFKIGSGKRNSKTQNAINLKNHNYFLKSDNYITNELFRFGGINSIRGFNENSLQGNTFISIITEYQLILSKGLYFHSVIDYGYLEDKTVNKSSKLIGLGFGFGLQTKNGLLNFIYANGSSNNEAIKFSNSVVQISLKTNF